MSKNNIAQPRTLSTQFFGSKSDFTLKNPLRSEFGRIATNCQLTQKSKNMSKVAQNLSGY